MCARTLFAAVAANVWYILEIIKTLKQMLHLWHKTYRNLIEVDYRRLLVVVIVVVFGSEDDDWILKWNENASIQ